nr:histidine phosphatase family protein [Petropleomorpha daqingensis]
MVIWRHGRTEWNAAGRFQGQLDPPLDDEGRRQAALVAPLLAAGPAADHPVVVSSDLVRAVETARALTDLLGVDLRTDARLREHGLGCWEGLTRDEVAERYPEQFADWRAGRPVRGRGGEEAAHVAERALAALAELPEAPLAVVVTHGGTAGRLMEALLGLDAEHRRVLGPLGNCSWSELVCQSGHWRLVRHNVWLPQPVEGGGPAPRIAVPAGASPEEGGAAAESDADAVL